MNNVNRELLKKLWILVHARQSIALAMEAHAVVCADHRDRQIGPVSVSVKCAVTTMYVSYARPFGPNHGLVRLNYDQCIKPLNLSDGVYRLDPTKEDWLVPTEATPGLFEITRGADPTVGVC